MSRFIRPLSCTFAPHASSHALARPLLLVKDRPFRSLEALLRCTVSVSALLCLLGPTAALAQTIDGGATVTVPGSQSSPWNIAGSLAVGNLSTGTLQIGTGGVVSSGSGFIGRQNTGIGTVTVSGAGAQWTSGPGLSVGNFGNGTLNITNGGRVSSTTNSYIAVSLGSTGAATVSGAGSQWNTTGFLRVGNTGNGTLDIADGAVVTNALGYVGYDATGVGTVSVSGPGSRWTNSSDLSVGTSGNGTLNITNNGAVSSVAGLIGSTASGRGVVTVSGAGSTWTNSSTLTVGAFGNGVLTISNGATVSAVSAVVAANGGSLGAINIGAAATDPAAAPGTLILTGPTPALSLGATGTLVFNHTDNSGGYEFTHGITGAGKLQTYSGTTVLTGNSTYTGGTTISAGTLQLGNGGTTGSIVGNVANNGTLVFDRSNLLSLGGVISGTGTVNQIGTGTTVLTGNSTYTGGTTISSGTLQLGSGGTTGSIVGNISNNAALAFNRSDVLTVGGVISGTGVVNQIGTGTTVLTGNSTYTGGTTISAGTLQLGNGGTTGSIVGNVTNNGTLAFNRSDVVTFPGVISGTGTVNQAGTGTTILTAANTYTGGTTIAAGTLQLGNGGTTGSIVGNVANNGTLSFNRSDTVTFPGVISGTGMVSQSGTGTTILTAANTYTGGTTIAAGTLQLGNGGTTGSIVGNVANNGTLAFNRSDIVTFPGVISGTGTVNQTGTGTTVLTAANSYTGGTTISAGTLQLGNGGTTGSIVGNVVDNGTLAFSRSDLIAFGGAISGTGTLSQVGTGTTVLSGTNSYAGVTTVASGGLYIDGNQAAATGATSVATGATLGGGGTVGGNVTVADGATLSPGSLSTAPGALAINGNLSLSGGSLLAYSFGQANVPGGALNDLVTVGGDLILDGTLNVVTSPGGSFDTGIYRVISYAGSLTDNTLAIGTIPSPNYFVQTSVPGQVNLVNTSGLTLNYWDGAIGPKNNGIVNGGNGLWQTSAGNDNWTDAAGTPNAPFSDGAFAIFTGAPGTVTVDNSLGAVTASGMQFAVDGYLITGDTLTLVDAPLIPGISVIRVGDGTAAGAGYTATIDAVLAGSTELVKADLGTLVLGGANTYSGGTLIRGGTISIASDGNLGAAAGGLTFDGGTLLTTADLTSARATTLAAGGGTIETAAGTQFIHGGAISGPGSLTKSGAGILTLLTDTTYAGGTTIAAGTLQLGNGGTSGSIVGDVVNDGTLVFNRADAVTFAGAISGTGAVSQLGVGTTILTADNSYTGGTTITAGTLQLGNGGTSGAIVGDVTNNGTLSFNRSNILTFAGAISGTGLVNQDGTGTTVLTSTANSYSGATNVNVGVLQAGAAGAVSANSAVTIAAAGTLDLNGFNQIVAGMSNAGLINMGAGTPPGTTLTTPNYLGLGGTIAMNTYLGADGSPSDRLVIDGGVGSGTSSILVSNVGGPGAPTTGNGILVVDAINGATTAAGAFALGNPGGYVAAGPYAYTLFHTSVDGSGPQNWYLRSTLDCVANPDLPDCQPGPGPDPDPPNYRPDVSTDVVVPELALRYGAALLDTLHERMGEERFFNRPVAEDGNSFAWGRIIGVTGESDGSPRGVFGSEGPGYDYRIFALQSGFDLYQKENENGSIDHAGVYAAFGRATADVDHFDGSFAGQAALNGVTLGGYWTHVGKEDWYLDAVAQGTWYDVNNNGSPSGNNLDTNGFGFGASLESGYPIRLDDEWVIEPQAQLVFQTISLDDGNDGAATIRYSDVDSLTGRLGVRLARTVELDQDQGDKRFATTWVRASLVNEFLANPTTEFSSQAGFVPFHTDMKGLSAQLNLGFDVELQRNLSLYGSVGSEISLEGDGQSLNGKLGLKVAF